MADYGCYPLWETSPNLYGNINPDDLPISEDLKKELLEWADEYDSILNWSDPASSVFPSKAAEDAFRKKGYELGERLKTELGKEFSVIMYIH